MNGLEKIAAQIRQQSQQEADALIAQAQRAADEQVAFAQTAADRAAAQEAAAARNHADAEVARASAAAAADGRRQLLAEKQAQIAAVLDEAARRIAALPDDAYFDRMLRMAARAAQPGDGEMVLSAADLQRLPGGTEYITDIGMTGPEQSVLGVKKEIIIDRMKNGGTEKFVIEKGPCILCGCIFDIDCRSGKCTGSRQIILREGDL